MKAAFGHFARKSWDLRGVRSGITSGRPQAQCFAACWNTQSESRQSLFTSQFSRVVALVHGVR